MVFQIDQSENSITFVIELVEQAYSLLSKILPAQQISLRICNTSKMVFSTNVLYEIKITRGGYIKPRPAAGSYEFRSVHLSVCPQHTILRFTFLQE